MVKPGTYKGMHYSSYVDEVRKLKRLGEYDKAIELLIHLVNAVEAEFKIEKLCVAPWYYEQLAIIYHKKRVYEAEVQILERFMRVNKGDHPLIDRLEKVRALL